LTFCRKEKSVLLSNFAETCRKNLGIVRLNGYFVFIINIKAFENVLVSALHPFTVACVELMTGLPLVLALVKGLRLLRLYLGLLLLLLMLHLGLMSHLLLSHRIHAILLCIVTSAV